MVFSRKNSLQQDLDIAGSNNYSTNKNLSDEIQCLGEPVGNSGSSASITVSGSDVIISGLSGIIDASLGRFLTFSGAASGVNNSTFLIIQINSSTSVNIEHSSAVTDGNNGSISWVERKSYSLEDDINFSRTDREAIKSAVGLDNNETDLSTKLTNTDGYYPFSDLPDLTPSVVEALNTLNEQIGDRVFSGSILDGYDGFTVTEILQVLADNSGGSGITSATAVGQVLYSTDGSTFTAEQPVTSDESSNYGWLVNNDGILLVSDSGGGVSSGLPSATQIGQILFSVDGSSFTAQLPITSEDGWLVNDNDILIVSG